MLRTLNIPLKAATLPFFQITPDCSRMITIATIECWTANNHEFRNLYTSGSMLAKYKLIWKHCKISQFCIEVKVNCFNITDRHYCRFCYGAQQLYITILCKINMNEQSERNFFYIVSFDSFDCYFITPEQPVMSYYMLNANLW